MAAERIELAALRGEIDELRGLLRADPSTADADVEDFEARLARNRPIRETSSVGWAKRVLEMSGGPMHVDDIIRNIQHMTGLPVSKATLVSNLSRYVKAGDTFKRTAANTFTLLKYDVDGEIRLVG
ncbi:MAG: hypothetical protein AB7F99_05260 [Vicinamibacterales bacterium]